MELLNRAVQGLSQHTGQGRDESAELCRETEAWQGSAAEQDTELDAAEQERQTGGKEMTATPTERCLVPHAWPALHSHTRHTWSQGLVTRKPRPFPEPCTESKGN